MFNLSGVMNEFMGMLSGTVSKGKVKLQLPGYSFEPGATVQGQATYFAGESARTLTWFRVYTRVTVSSVQVGQHGWSPHKEHREVLPYVELHGPMHLGAGQSWGAPFTLQFPPSMMASLPGQVDYSVQALAHVDGHLIDVGDLAQVLIAGAGATAPPVAQVPVGIGMVGQPAAPGVFPQGARCRAVDPSGQWSPGTVVQQNGIMVLVQWSDGRPAMWVRSDQVQPS